MLGGMALLWKWRARQRAAGKPADRPNLISGPVQVCWHKFARYWDVELREIPMEGDRLLMTPEEVLARVDENTIGVVPTLGVTFTGQYEPVHAVSDALDALQEDSGLDVPIHVDGASGGFLAPFTPRSRLGLPAVAREVHQRLGAQVRPRPAGRRLGAVARRGRPAEDLVFNVNYLGGNMPTFALNFSRPGGQIVAQYYNFLRLGREGYARIHAAVYATAQYLAERDREARALRHHLRRAPRNPGAVLEAARRCGPRLHAVRPGGPVACRGLAGAGLHAAGPPSGPRDPAHPGASRLQPGPGRSCSTTTGAPSSTSTSTRSSTPMTEEEAGSFHH